MNKCNCIVGEDRLSVENKLQAKTALIVSPKKINFVNKIIEPPQGKQVRIKVQGCGICGSNIPLWEGRKWFQYPCEEGCPGHEGWGIIDAKGSNVTQYNVGDRVTFLSQNAFSEYVEVNESNIVKLPAIMNNSPFPGEPFGCAMNIFNRFSVKKGDIIAIVGIGFIGAVLTALAVHNGARVIAISRRRYSLLKAKEMGASETIPMEDRNIIIENVMKLTNGELCDTVIEATGLQSCLDIASSLTRVRGKMVIAGYHQDGTRIVNMQAWNWNGIDVINAHERNEKVYVDGIKKAVNAVSEGILEPHKLITHQFPFESLQDAFEISTQRPDGFLKAVVVM